MLVIIPQWTEKLFAQNCGKCGRSKLILQDSFIKFSNESMLLSCYTTPIPKKLWCCAKCMIKTECNQCQPKCFHRQLFSNCSWAYVVISFVHSFAAPVSTGFKWIAGIKFRICMFLQESVKLMSKNVKYIVLALFSIKHTPKLISILWNSVILVLHSILTIFRIFVKARQELLLSCAEGC